MKLQLAGAGQPCFCCCWRGCRWRLDHLRNGQVRFRRFQARQPLAIADLADDRSVPGVVRLVVEPRVVPRLDLQPVVERLGLRLVAGAGAALYDRTAPGGVVERNAKAAAARRRINR
ncbi:hypothetical protein G3N99_17215 [Burkholderia sp. Ac-20392]|nr:hypothetical protein [Burkholderia sp. Ac-20392]